MDEGTLRILQQIEGGRHIFRPLGATPEYREAFQHEVDRLLHLRAIGLIRLEESRIKRAPDGRYESAGPCDLTPAGIAALSNSRRLADPPQLPRQPSPGQLPRPDNPDS